MAILFRPKSVVHRPGSVETDTDLRRLGETRAFGTVRIYVLDCLNAVVCHRCPRITRPVSRPVQGGRPLFARDVFCPSTDSTRLLLGSASFRAAVQDRVAWKLWALWPG